MSMFCKFSMILFLVAFKLLLLCEHCNTAILDFFLRMLGEEPSRPHIYTNSCSCLTLNFNGDTSGNKYELLTWLSSSKV